MDNTLQEHDREWTIPYMYTTANEQHPISTRPRIDITAQVHDL